MKPAGVNERSSSRFPATQKQPNELLALRALCWFRQASLLKRQSPSIQRLLPHNLMLTSIKNVVLIKTVPPDKEETVKDSFCISHFNLVYRVGFFLIRIHFLIKFMEFMQSRKFWLTGKAAVF